MVLLFSFALAKHCDFFKELIFILSTVAFYTLKNHPKALMLSDGSLLVYHMVRTEEVLEHLYSRSTVKRSD